MSRVLDNYLAPGLRQYGAYRMAQSVNNTMTAAQLGLSAFHATVVSLESMISRVALGTQQLGRGEVRQGVSNIAQGSYAMGADTGGGQGLQAH